MDGLLVLLELLQARGIEPPAPIMISVTDNIGAGKSYPAAALREGLMMPQPLALQRECSVALELLYRHAEGRIQFGFWNQSFSAARRICDEDH